MYRYVLRMASLIYILNGKSWNASDQIYDILMMEKWNPKWNLIWKALGQHITSFSWPFLYAFKHSAVHRSASVHFSTTYLIKCPAFDGLFAQRIYRVSCWRKHSGQCKKILFDWNISCAILDKSGFKARFQLTVSC